MPRYKVPKTTTITISIPITLSDHIRAFCAEYDQGLSPFVRAAIMAGMDEAKDATIKHVENMQKFSG